LQIRFASTVSVTAQALQGKKSRSGSSYDPDRQLRDTVAILRIRADVLDLAYLRQTARRVGLEIPASGRARAHLDL